LKSEVGARRKSCPSGNRKKKSEDGRQKIEEMLEANYKTIILISPGGLNLGSLFFILGS
jgi:hypothetical protein